LPDDLFDGVDLDAVTTMVVEGAAFAELVDAIATDFAAVTIVAAGAFVTLVGLPTMGKVACARTKAV
jgi:hypothetical protein